MKLSWRKKNLLIINHKFMFEEEEIEEENIRTGFADGPKFFFWCHDCQKFHNHGLPNCEKPSGYRGPHCEKRGKPDYKIKAYELDDLLFMRELIDNMLKDYYGYQEPNN